MLNTAEEQDWETAFRKIYKLESVDELESHWHKWIVAGSPRNQHENSDIEVAASKSPDGTIVRGQSPDQDKLLDKRLESEPTGEQFSDRSLLTEESSTRIKRPEPQLLRVSSKQ
ncbi:MAG: hypothetical protein R3C11_03995 [Planctomycetaceae bacterium]